VFCVIVFFVINFPELRVVFKRIARDKQRSDDKYAALPVADKAEDKLLYHFAFS
jgi:hypothetical protein